MKGITFAMLALAAGWLVPAIAHAAIETWTIDPEHTYPSFEFPHMGISVWRGKFTGTSGRITIDREGGTGTVEIDIDPASIEFGHEGMNEHAQGGRWFDVAQFPNARYRGTLRLIDGEPSMVEGDLTVRGVTRPLRLTISKFACTAHPLHGRRVCGADARGELHWSDFGFSPMEQRDAERVRLLVQVEATLQQ